MLDVMQRGGPFMWVILAVSVVALAIIVERTWVLWLRYRLDAGRLLDEVVGLVEEKKLSRALELCNVRSGHPLPEVLKAGLVKANESDRDIQRALETAMLRVMPRVTRRVGYLSLLANVSTLLGLLGTIMGLIEAFRGVAAADAATKQDILSKGIAVAMFTTAFGLIAAIPAMIAFTVLQNRQSALLSELEEKASALFEYLSARNRRLPRKRA